MTRSEGSPQAILRISLPRFRDNLRTVQQRVAPSELMLVMKDDAYGHGVSWAASAAAAAGVRWFGGYDIDTAVRIQSHLTGEQRVFAWAIATDPEVDEALAHGIDLGVGTRSYLGRVAERARVVGRTARVHLKIDTGLHRNGIRGEEWATVIADAARAQASGLVELVGVWSHLAEASDDEDDIAHLRFQDAVLTSGAVPWTHLTASAASWWRPELRGTLSRVGAFCYGIRSAGGPALEGIQPIASLVARVVHCSGTDVRIGLGSMDGLPSTLRGATVGTPAGPRLLQHIDLTTAQVESWPKAAVGDEVIVFGPGASGESSATSLAERIDTVGEEILTRLTSRVPRVVCAD